MAKIQKARCYHIWKGKADDEGWHRCEKCGKMVQYSPLGSFLMLLCWIGGFVALIRWRGFVDLEIGELAIRFPTVDSAWWIAMELVGEVLLLAVVVLIALILDRFLPTIEKDPETEENTDD